MRSGRDEELPDHGTHTLRVWNGTVVGRNGDDVFVELGPRMQGFLSVKRFASPPRPGEEYEFTVLGQEDGLWALALAEEGLLASWEDMVVGSWVQARVTGKNPGGLELKVGPLHAFMPKSETGLARDQSPKILVGKTLTCEVIEIDRERQRVLVSRKRVLRRQRESETRRQTGSLKVGQVIQGRVTRLEDYGAFVRFGQGLEGLVHISNLSLDRVAHPSEVLEGGETVEAKVLTVRGEGKRIGLGIKQMSESPWKALARTAYRDQVFAGEVTRVESYGAFVRVARGVEGLVHRSQAGVAANRRLGEILRPGQELTVRLVELDAEAERLELSALHRDGSPLLPEEALTSEELGDEAFDANEALGGTNLGVLLARAFRPRDARD